MVIKQLEQTTSHRAYFDVTRPLDGVDGVSNGHNLLPATHGTTGVIPKLK